MKKILVTGNAGAGKSSAVKQLSRDLNIKSYSLDEIVWKSGWKKTSKQERDQRIQEIVNQPLWIIDGVSIQVMKQADAIIFIDLPRWKCLLNIVKRFLKNGPKTREGLPSNCPEIVGVFKAAKISWGFPSKARKKIITQLESDAHTKKIIHIQSYHQLNALPDQLLGD